MLAKHLLRKLLHVRIFWSRGRKEKKKERRSTRGKVAAELEGQASAKLVDLLEKKVQISAKFCEVLTYSSLRQQTEGLVDLARSRFSMRFRDQRGQVQLHPTGLIDPADPMNHTKCGLQQVL